MDQKHYNYVGNAPIRPKSSPLDIEVKKVEFYVPVRVYMEVDGQEIYKTAHLDYANQKLYFEDDAFNNDDLRAKVFGFIAGVTQLPENRHEAGDEIYDQVDRAHGEFDKMQEIKEGEIDVQ